MEITARYAQLARPFSGMFAQIFYVKMARILPSGCRISSVFPALPPTVMSATIPNRILLKILDLRIGKAHNGVIISIQCRFSAHAMPGTTSRPFFSFLGWWYQDFTVTIFWNTENNLSKRPIFLPCEQFLFTSHSLFMKNEPSVCSASWTNKDWILSTSSR